MTSGNEKKEKHQKHEEKSHKQNELLRTTNITQGWIHKSLTKKI